MLLHMCLLRDILIIIFVCFMMQEMEPYVTIVGFGSLLSKRSALTTTPSLRNYQYVRVKGFKRLFQHPAAIFFERGPPPGIALPETKEISSLSTTPDPDASFVACAYQIPKASSPSPPPAA